MQETPKRVQSELERIQAAIRRRQGFDSDEDAPGTDISRTAIDEAAAHARINAHWGITSEAPVIGRFVVLARRAMRIGLRWYINPIVEQQNRFNESVVRALYELQAEIEDVRLKDDRSEKNG